MRTYDILIPAYNSAASLATLLHDIGQLKSPPQNIIVVDDGSTDQTATIALKGEATVLRNKRNMGKGYSLRFGFKYFLERSTSSYVLCMDADLQHPVSSVPGFIKQTESDKTFIVIGNRSKSLREMPFLRVLSNRITSALLSLITGQKIKDSQCGFRLIRREVLENIRLTENGFQLESEFIIEAVKNKYPLRFINIPTIYNQEESNINHLGDTFRFIRLLAKELF